MQTTRRPLLLVLAVFSIDLILFLKLNLDKDSHLLNNSSAPQSTEAEIKITDSFISTVRRINISNSNVDSKNRSVKVLLMSANPRSGSSFIGDILTMDEGDYSMLLFEPLRYLEEDVPPNRMEPTSVLPKNSTSAIVPKNVSSEEKLTMVEDFFNCRYIY